jgi:hypothetical protein
VITVTQETNSPSQCTEDVTPAFIKQSYGGSLAACISSGKQPIGPKNATSVDVSSITGAGDYAIADATFHLTSGKTQKVAVAIYRQNGSWRLLGFENR